MRSNRQPLFMRILGGHTVPLCSRGLQLSCDLCHPALAHPPLARTELDSRRDVDGETCTNVVQRGW